MSPRTDPCDDVVVDNVIAVTSLSALDVVKVKKMFLVVLLRVAPLSHFCKKESKRKLQRRLVGVTSKFPFRFPLFGATLLLLLLS